MTLTRSKDRKVTNSVSPNGKTATIANAFGLPSGRAFSCPGATDYCERICYAGKLEKIYKGVRNVLTSNWEQLQVPGDEIHLLDEMITAFEAECDKREADKLFRIHWDGDFFSDEYTWAWAYVIRKHPLTQFWVYTRVVSSAVILHNLGLKNLALYFSADRDNIESANVLRDQDGIKIAYVDETFEAGKAQFPKATRCPENNKALPLISTKGSACVVCGLCVNGRKDVLFSRTKK